MIRQVQKTGSNMDIDFQNVEEATNIDDEVSPLPRLRVRPNNEFVKFKTQHVTASASPSLLKESTMMSAGGEGGANEYSVSCIKGIPRKQFIEEILKQERARKESEGTLEDFPIKIPGFGLHAILEKQKVKEEKAKRTKPRNAKFSY